MRNPDPASHSELAPRQVQVLIVQDHPLLASAIARVLEGQPDLAVSGVCASGADAVEAAAQNRPDVVLMDFRLPDVTGPAAARTIKSAHADAAIVFHSADESETALLDAIDAGATAYLTKDATADQIIEAVRRASRGEVLIPVELFARAIARQRGVVTKKREREQLLAEFTPRELDILHLLAEGLDTTAMSQSLGIAPHTVEWHVRHVIEKLQVHSKLQAVIAAGASFRRGLIQPSTVSSAHAFAWGPAMCMHGDKPFAYTRRTEHRMTSASEASAACLASVFWSLPPAVAGSRGHGRADTQSTSP